MIYQDDKNKNQDVKNNDVLKYYNDKNYKPAKMPDAEKKFKTKNKPAKMPEPPKSLIFMNGKYKAS